MAQGRVPAAAVDIDDAVPIALLGMMDIEQQRQSRIHAINDVGLGVTHGWTLRF